MKRIVLSILIVGVLLLSACGDGIANNPIEVVDKVKVGMTRVQVEEVVDIDYFRDNRSWRGLMISDVKITDKGFSYTISDDQSEVAPYVGDFFFSVESDIDVALIVFEYFEADSTQDVVLAVGVIPFARAKAIVTEDGWRLRN